MMNELMQDTDLLILDFDGTFYEFTHDLAEVCDKAAARTALKLGAPLSFEVARAMATESYRRCGSGLTAFEEIYGLPREVTHQTYFDELDGAFNPCSTVSAADFEACAIPKVILSHSNRAWMKKLLDQFDLAHLFPDERIFALEDVHYHLKNGGDQAYRAVLDRTGVLPSRAVVVEDSVVNLKTAKKMGLRTVYLTQGVDANDSADFATSVDAVFDNLSMFLKRIS